MNSAPDTPSDDTLPRSRPGQMSGRMVTVVLYAAILLTISGVVGIAYRKGRPSDKPLPVIVQLDHRRIDVPDGSGAVMTDAIVISNQSDAPIPKLDVSINGQYFLYRDSPLKPHEELVLPQSIFSTKSNIRYDPRKYPVQSVVVTGRLPSGSRGVHKHEIQK